MAISLCVVFRIAISFVAIFLATCAEDAGQPRGFSQTPLTIHFNAQVGKSLLECGTEYGGLGLKNSTAEIADARLFVSGIELLDPHGDWQPFQIADSSPWQSGGVALLDFEDGTAACSDSGTPLMNQTVTGVVGDGGSDNYDGIRFVVGVPNELNHLDNALTDAPLNVPGMFWTWQSGYKFIRLDLNVRGESNKRFNIHIGSTGCASSAPTKAPTEPCARENRSVIELEGPFEANDIVTVSMDLASLISGANLEANTPATAPGCMSSAADSVDCAPLYRSLGMSFENGRCVEDCVSQKVFELGK